MDVPDSGPRPASRRTRVLARQKALAEEIMQEDGEMLSKLAR